MGLPCKLRQKGLPCKLKQKDIKEVKFTYMASNKGKNVSLGVVSNSFAVVLKSGIVNPNIATESSPAIVLDDSCIMEHDFSCSLMETALLSCIRVCVKTKPHVLINDKVKIIIKGQIHWICVKELEAWMLKFNTKTEDDTYLKEESEGNNENDLGGKAVNSEDPFRIYKILKRNKDTSGSEGDTPQYPQGFTPVDEENVVGNNPGNASQPNPTKSGNNEKAQSNKDICNHGTKFQASGSILEVMDELIKVGHTMSYNMDGCMKNIKTIIGS
nr:RNA-directed DNA polymerase, eukaryota, nucleotide-binding alpha-beta plait domain protein [Tanacetum cinerariifolium]